MNEVNSANGLKPFADTFSVINKQICKFISQNSKKLLQLQQTLYFQTKHILSKIKYE